MTTSRRVHEPVEPPLSDFYRAVRATLADPDVAVRLAAVRARVLRGIEEKK